MSLQYREIEKASHHALNSIPKTLIQNWDNLIIAWLPTLRANKTNRVMATQRVTVLKRSIRRSDFIQNERTKSQSPAEPIAEPVIRTKSS